MSRHWPEHCQPDLRRSLLRAANAACRDKYAGERQRHRYTLFS
jgi:hypothetical protein